MDLACKFYLFFQNIQIPLFRRHLIIFIIIAICITEEIIFVHQQLLICYLCNAPPLDMFPAQHIKIHKNNDIQIVSPVF